MLTVATERVCKSVVFGLISFGSLVSAPTFSSGSRSSCHIEDMDASSLPLFDLLPEARAGRYLSDHHPMDTSDAVDTLREAPASFQFATRQNPQGEVELSQLYGSSPTSWMDAIRNHGSTSPLHIQPGGVSHEDYERVQSIPGVELNFEVSEDTASRHDHQQDSGDTCVGKDRQRELLTFPAGEVDAVTITARDLEGLQPMRFLSNNIIDFYIKCLERRLSSEDRKRFYFFNSFFFTKLLGNSSSFLEIDECGVDYDQVGKWTGEVNLFEKDYVFIPILRSSHWSLIIICHLSGLTSLPDERRGPPCVFHLDPVEGRHGSFESQIRSYTVQAWMERYRDSIDRDRIILALACQMKYIRANVPQQGNGYDCGLYLLHYVEVFLRESTSPDFSFVSSRGGSHFTSPHFAGEVSGKRATIQNLIFELNNTLQERAASRMDIQPEPERRASDAHNSRPQPSRLPKPPNLQNKSSKKWQEVETSVLLNRMVEGGRIRKGTKGGTHWDLISRDIKTKVGTMRSEDECRRRYDTLLKAYKKIKKTGKAFSDIVDDERVGLNLATPLSEEWYKAIDTICLQRRSANAKSRKRAKVNISSDDNPRNPPPVPVPSGCPEPGKPSRKHVAIPGFSTLDGNLRSALCNLIQAWLMKDWWARNLGFIYDPTISKLEEVCQWLAIVQDRNPSEIRKFMFKLSELKLVSIEYYDWSEKEELCLKLSNLLVYKKFLEKVVRRNPDFDIYMQIRDNFVSVSFPKVPLSLSLQRIRVLCLYGCKELRHADLSYFPELRSLAIERCGKLKLLTGWKVVKELGWLEICDCASYRDFPCVECLPSLREFRFKYMGSSAPQLSPVPDFSQCVRLRMLEIWSSNSSALNSVDLSTLRFLEVLTFCSCPALTTIQGLSGLHSLTRLTLRWCSALRRVPELGCLKALTHLDMSASGVEEIPGVQELHLLTYLKLFYCSSLKKLPCVGHLKALTYLNICGCGVEEIPGVEGLVNLETLLCSDSRVKWLPDPHHFPRLRSVLVSGTPLRTDPSSCYYGKGYLEFNCEEERMGFLDIVKDVSDTEDNH